MPFGSLGNDVSITCKNMILTDYTQIGGESNR